MRKTLLSLLLILALLAGCAPSGGSSAPEEGEGTQSSRFRSPSLSRSPNRSPRWSG